MFRKHSKVISVILSLTLIATMCIMSAASFSAADKNFFVVGTMQGWAPTTADPMTNNGDGTWTKVYTDLPVGEGGFKVTDAQGAWDTFTEYNENGEAGKGGSDVKYEITEANSTMTIIFSETELKVLSWDITTGEQPTGETTASDPTAPSSTDASEPSTAPSAGTVTINGEEYETGDQVVYTAYLKVAELAAGINVHVAYDGDLLKVSDQTRAAKKSEVIPVAYTGSCVLNFDTVDSSSQVFFNSNDIDEGYDFTGDNRVLITLTFDVIGTSGTGTIKAYVDELLGMMNADKENLPIADFALTDSTGKADPVIPTATETETATATETETATETQPPVADKVIINGVQYNQGDIVTYTAYLKTNELAAGLNVFVDYSGDLLKLTDDTLNARKRDVIPVAYTGSSMLNFAPIDGASQVLFNSNDIDEGYDFTVDNAVLITLKFEVTAKSGTGSIKANIAELLGMTNKDNQNLPITDYTLTEKLEGGTEPTQPTGTEPTQPTGTEPTQPTGTEPTQPTGTEPTQPTGTEPTQPTGTEPTQPTGTEPTEPTGTEPTEPTGTEPTEPTGTEPTEPTGTEPTEPTGTEPTEPTGTEPTEPTGTEPTEPTQAPTSAPTQAPTQAPTNGGTTGGVTTGDSTSVALLLAILMLAAGAVVVARKRIKE